MLRLKQHNKNLILIQKSIHNNMKMCHIVMVKYFFFVFFYHGFTNGAAGSLTLWKIERKVLLVKHMEGSRVLVCSGAASLMGTQSKQSWIPVGACEALEGAQPLADKRCQLTAGPTHQLRVHSWLTGHIHCIRSGSTQQTFPPSLGYLAFSSISPSLSTERALLWC